MESKFDEEELTPSDLVSKDSRIQKHSRIQRFARIVSVNGSKNPLRMLKVLGMTTRDLKLGIVNSAFITAYQGNEDKKTIFEGLPEEEH